MSLPLSYKKINDEIKALDKEKEIIIQEEVKNKDVIYDFEKGQFIFDSAEPHHITSRVEIVKEWIRKLFMTARDTWNCHIYDVGYPFGLNLYKYVGHQLYPNMDLIALIKEDIYNSLMNNPDIKEIHCLQLVQIEDKLYCGFIVELSEDVFEIEEVLNGTIN